MKWHLFFTLLCISIIGTASLWQGRHSGAGSSGLTAQRDKIDIDAIGAVAPPPERTATVSSPSDPAPDPIRGKLLSPAKAGDAAFQLGLDTNSSRLAENLSKLATLIEGQSIQQTVWKNFEAGLRKSGSWEEIVSNYSTLSNDDVSSLSKSLSGEQP